MLQLVKLANGTEEYIHVPDVPEEPIGHTGRRRIIWFLYYFIFIVIFYFVLKKLKNFKKSIDK